MRGVITAGETSTRFQLGLVAGVGREIVGLAGTAGQLVTTVAEMQVSPAARAEYGQAIVDGALGAANATGRYVADVAADPSRIGSDVRSVVDAGGRFVDGQLDRYSTAIREGRGPETIGIDAGTIATYIVPVGGGPVRGAVTSAARTTGEVAAREAAEVVARRAAGLADDVARLPVGPVAGVSDVARVTGTSTTRLQEVVDLGRGNRPAPAEYLTPQRIAEHRAAFDDGASRFTLQETIDKYGLGQRDGTSFVMTRAEADAIVRSSGGDLRRLEEALGLPAGQLDSGALRRVDFPPEALDDLNIRMPTGNEAGANAQWLPGGYLPSGANEAVVDGARAAPGQFSIRVVE